MKVSGVGDTFLNFRLTHAFFFLIMLVCVLSLVVMTNYANAKSRPIPAITIKKVVTNARHVSDTNASKWNTVEMRVTAYCPCPKCCGEYSDGITACGHKIGHKDTFVAADRQFPFGTEMVIPGYNNGKPVKVLDRGGAIYANRIDVFFQSHQQALNWGVRYLDVKIGLK